MRNVTVNRETKETNITITLNPDGHGQASVDSGVPFFDHMLTAMAKHGRFDIVCTAKGDLGVDIQRDWRSEGGIDHAFSG